MQCIRSLEEQATIWDYYKPRQTHAWNMLVLSWNSLEKIKDDMPEGFEVEYLWENYALRLWLYRTSVKTLTKISSISTEAYDILVEFDKNFEIDGQNVLKSFRNMIEHFDDYAAGNGRSQLATRLGELDPWRHFSKERYERGRLVFDRIPAMEAADKLRSDAKKVSDKFIAIWKLARNQSGER